MVFVRASEDATVGCNQRTNQFNAKFWDEYKNLIKIANDRMGTSFGFRTKASAYNRSKKMSRFALKLIGCEKSAGDPPSGDTGKEEWEKSVRKIFVTRNPDGKNMVENIYMVKIFLQDFPKWQAYEEEDTANAAKKRARPEGTKKAKEKKADQQFVMKCLASTSGTEDEQANKKRYVEKKESFFETMSIVVKSMAQSMEDSNDMKLLSYLSPNSKAKLAKTIFAKKMSKLRSNTDIVFEGESVSSPMTGDENANINIGNEASHNNN
jgi:hypothetical protein